MKVGNVYRSEKLNNGWNIWHEILKIDGNMITLCNYGKGTEYEEVQITKREFLYCLRNGIILEA